MDDGCGVAVAVAVGDAKRLFRCNKSSPGFMFWLQSKNIKITAAFKYDENTKCKLVSNLRVWKKEY